MIPLPNISDIIHYFLNNAGSWISAFLPFTGLIVGISAFGLIGSMISDWFNWQDEKHELNDMKLGFQELLGSEAGGQAFMKWDLLSNLSGKDIDPVKFILPRDYMAGSTMNSFLSPSIYKNQERLPVYWRNYPAYTGKYPLNPPITESAHVVSDQELENYIENFIEEPYKPQTKIISQGFKT